MKMVLLSGGVDSSTALALALKKDPNVIAVSFTYNQSHEKMEMKAAQDIADYYQVKRLVIDLATIFKGSHSSLNRANHMAITEGDYAKQESPNTEVEFRNGVFIAILASLAKQYGADEVFFGAHQDDSGTIYPDCSPEFIQAMDLAVQLGTGHQVSLSAPFKQVTKATIVKIGLELGVPYALTYSCYEGTNPPCGKCGTCIDRRKAFQANGLDLL